MIILALIIGLFIGTFVGIIITTMLASNRIKEALGPYERKDTSSPRYPLIYPPQTEKQR